MAKSRVLARIVGVGALALTLTGCIKLDMDLSLNSDDTVDGSIIFAVNRSALDLAGGSFEDLLQGETPIPEGIDAKVTAYEDDDFVGQRFEFDGAPLSEFSGMGEQDLSIVRQGDTFVVTGNLDMSRGVDGTAGFPGAEQLLETFQVRIAVTFPGKVLESTGDIDGRTTSWEPAVGSLTTIRAVGEATGSGSSTQWLIFLLIAIVILAVVAGLVMVARRKTAVVTAGEMPGTDTAMPMAGDVATPFDAPPAAPPVAAPPPAAPPVAASPPATPPVATPLAPETQPTPAPDAGDDAPTAGGDGNDD